MGETSAAKPIPTGFSAMCKTGYRPWEVLSATHVVRVFVGWVDGRTEEIVSRRPEPRRWSAMREILAHLADTELVFSWRMQNILASGIACYLRPYDQNEFARVFESMTRTPFAKASLDLFEANRRGNPASAARQGLGSGTARSFGMHEANVAAEHHARLIRLNARARPEPSRSEIERLLQVGMTWCGPFGPASRTRP